MAQPARWTEAAARYLAARLRGAVFARLQRERQDDARRRLRRLLQLEARLLEDRRGLVPAEDLRRQAEALLAAGPLPVPAGAERVDVADPYDADRRLGIAIDPRLSLPVNADRLFDKARRMDRAARHVADRLEQARRDIARARSDQEAASSARDAADLRPPSDEAGDEAGARASGGPRRYLTSGGLSLLVGRGARQNQQLTFSTAGPEDWWLHARDVPGAHVVLRDPEGRAAEQDLREAAEVAAFFSDARGAAQADVHATRRKHVRPAGAPGRVRVMHSDTLRVRPKDPEGRLRKR